MPWSEEMAALRQRVAQLEAALTAQQHGEQALHEAKDAAEQIVETVREPLLVLTPDFRLQSANPAFYHLFQVHPTETIGQSIYQLGDRQWDIPELHILLEQILPQNTLFNDYEVSHDFERIGPRTLLLNARRLDHVQFILLALEDITGRKQAETRLQQQQAQLEQQVQERTAALRQEMAEQSRFEAIRAEAEIKRQHATLEAQVRVQQRLEMQLRQTQTMEALGTLAGGIAHEFNNILAALLGFATLLHREVPPKSRAGLYVQQVRQAGNRAKELVQQILTFSRAESPAREPLEIDQVVQEALTLLRASLPSTVDIQYHVSEPGVTVQANRTQLHEVIMNLGANADYAMRQSGGRLTAHVDLVEVDAAFAMAHPPLSPGSYVCLRMDDTGSGMTPEVMTHIFEPFFTTKTSGAGSGMGLAIVHGIITSHEGLITVESCQGAGTRVAVYLPAVDSPVAPVVAPELSVPQGKGRVLLVDDEETVALAIQFLLESLGYDVVVHTRSRDALEAFRADPNRFDVVITDQTMPQMTGEDFIHALHRLRPELPVILCTGFSHVMDSQKAQALGQVTFLMKPVDAYELGVLLQQLLVRQSKSP
jgi:signal transduction histidine kinase/ActR/RegA family two-component response regulator